MAGTADRQSAENEPGMRGLVVGIVAILLTAAIFAIDALTPLGYALAVLYAIVVMLVATVLNATGILAVAGICVVFTVVGFVAGHSLNDFGAVARAGMSLVSVAIAAALSVRDKGRIAELERQAAQIELTHDAIFTRTPEGRITDWNRGAEALYGWTAAEAIGQPETELIAGAALAEWQAANTSLFETGYWEGELRPVRRDGSEVIVACRWVLQRNGRGVPQMILETHSDITAQVVSEAALDRARMELDHAARLSVLGELAGSIAHEVNQPLAAIVASGEAGLRWVDREEPAIEEVTTSLQRIIGAARRASEVITRLRALARKSDTERVELNLNEVVDDVLMLLQRELAAHDVTVHMRQDPAGAPVLGDRVQLQQVLINLVINAIQAMQTVTDRRREIAVTVADPAAGNDAGGRVTLTVRDTGPGLSDAVTEKLFSAFTTTKPQGMGLGLSISRRIIEAHGGRIAASPSLPHGATFTIELPALETTDP